MAFPLEKFAHPAKSYRISIQFGLPFFKINFRQKLLLWTRPPVDNDPHVPPGDFIIPCQVAVHQSPPNITAPHFASHFSIADCVLLVFIPLSFVITLSLYWMISAHLARVVWKERRSCRTCFFHPVQYYYTHYNMKSHFFFHQHHLNHQPHHHDDNHRQIRHLVICTTLQDYCYTCVIPGVVSEYLPPILFPHHPSSSAGNRSDNIIISVPN